MVRADSFPHRLQFRGWKRWTRSGDNANGFNDETMIQICVSKHFISLDRRKFKSRLKFPIIAVSFVHMGQRHRSFLLFIIFLLSERFLWFAENSIYRRYNKMEDVLYPFWLSPLNERNNVQVSWDKCQFEWESEWLWGLQFLECQLLRGQRT